MPDQAPTLPQQGDTPWLRQVTFHSLLASLTPLIPLPFADDWAYRRVERRMVADSFRRRGLTPETWHLDALCWDGDVAPRGCSYLLLLIWRLGLYVVKKIFRKLVFFLTIKDSIDRFSTAFHTGYLLEVAFDQQVINSTAIAGGERLIEVREAILATCQAVDPRPFNQLVRRILSGSKRVLLSASRLFAKSLRREQAPPLTQEETAVGGLLDRLTAAIRNETAYQDQLERTFREALNKTPPSQ